MAVPDPRSPDRPPTPLRSDAWPRIAHAPLRRLRALLAAGVCLVLLGLISHGHYAGSGDAVHYMMIARSLVVGGDLDLADDYGDPANILTTPAERHALPGRHGALRPVHDVGLPLAAAPYFAVAYRLADRTERLPESLRRRAKLDRFIALRQLVSLFMIGVTAWLAVVFFQASWCLTGERSWAWLWAFAWTLSPPILSHGYVFLTEIPTALLALLVYQRREDAAGPGLRGAALGALTGLLVLVHVRNVGLTAAFVILSLWQARHALHRTVPYLGGLAAAGACKIGLNLLFWGTWLTTPHAQVGGWPGAGPLVAAMTERGIGLLVDARHGLLPSAPIYLAAPAAWLLLWRRSRTTALHLAFIVGGYLVFVLCPLSNVHGWRGGWSPAARFLVPVTPFLMLGVPALLAHRTARWLVGALLCIQVPLNVFLWGHPMLTWSEGAGPAPFVEGLLGSAAASAMPTVQGSTVAGMAGWILALALWCAGTTALVRNSDPRSSAGA